MLLRGLHQIAPNIPIRYLRVSHAFVELTSTRLGLHKGRIRIDFLIYVLGCLLHPLHLNIRRSLVACHHMLCRSSLFVSDIKKLSVRH